MSTIYQTELTAIVGAPGGSAMVSLPIPRDAGTAVAVGGRLAQTVPVGYWPRSERTPGGPRAPRRALVFFDTAGDDVIPIELRQEGGENATGDARDVTRRDVSSGIRRPFP